MRRARAGSRLQSSTKMRVMGGDASRTGFRKTAWGGAGAGSRGFRHRENRQMRRAAHGNEAVARRERRVEIRQEGRRVPGSRRQDQEPSSVRPQGGDEVFKIIRRDLGKLLAPPVSAEQSPPAVVARAVRRDGAEVKIEVGGE